MPVMNGKASHTLRFAATTHTRRIQRELENKHICPIEFNSITYCLGSMLVYFLYNVCVDLLSVSLLGRYVNGSWAFFYCYIAVAVIVFMNLVTAVIVENALSHSKQADKPSAVREKPTRGVFLDKTKILYQIFKVLQFT